MDPQFVSRSKGDPQIPGEFTSLWINTTPRTNFPSLSKDLTVDVAIIGGGIVGISTALLLKEAGKKVAVIEAGKIVESTTGFTTAKITSQHSLVYEYLISTFGKKQAKIYAEANEKAIDQIETIVSKYNIQCDFFRTPAYTFAESSEDGESVKKEVIAAKSLGLPASFEDKIPLPLKSFGAIKFDRQAQFHPRKYLLPLADKIPGDGSFIFENTKALDFEEGEPCVVTTTKGGIKAKDVVVATHVPFLKEPGFFFSRLYQIHSYVLGLYIKGEIPQGMFYGTKSHTIRNQPVEKGTVLIAGGEDHKTGQGGDTIERYQRLVNYYSKNYLVEKINYYWSTQDPDTPDRIPFIGKASPNSKHVYMASGFHGWGMTQGTISAMLISDLILGKSNPWEELYNPSRTDFTASAKRFISEGANTAKKFMEGKIADVKELDIATLKNGEGKVGKVNGKTVGVYKDNEGKIYAVSPFCSFEGCRLYWNNAEKTWDCPCCGSRFTFDGKVLYGPAINDLQKIDL